MAEHNLDQSLNITIKEEPIDEYEYALDEITIKDEPDDQWVSEEPILDEPDFYNTNIFSNNNYNNSPPSTIINSTRNKDSPVTRKIIINGEEKMCVLVKSPQSSQSMLDSNGQRGDNFINTINYRQTTSDTLRVQCPRCKNTVAMDTFRQHIDSCPPRYPRKGSKLKHNDDSTSVHKTTEDTPENYYRNTLYRDHNDIRSGDLVQQDTNPFAQLKSGSNKNRKDTLYESTELPTDCSKEQYTVSRHPDTIAPAWTLYMGESRLTSMRTRSKSVSYCPENTNRGGLRNEPRATENHESMPSVEQADKEIADSFPDTNKHSSKITEDSDKNPFEQHKEKIRLSPRRTRSKSCPRHLNNRRRPSTDTDSQGTSFGARSRRSDYLEKSNFTMRTRSRSMHRSSNTLHKDITFFEGDKDQTKTKFNCHKNTDFTQEDSQHRSKLIPEKQDKSDHASQMAYYQKFLEIRRRSVSNRVDLNSKHNNNVSENKLTDDDVIAKPSSKVRESITKETEDVIENISLLTDTTFSCSMCSFTTDKNIALKKHEWHHRNRSTPIFQCLYCNQKYTRYALYLHIQSVHPGQKFQITDQGEKCIEPNPLVIANGKEPEQTTAAKCPKCSFSAESDSILKEHIESHSAEKKPNISPTGKNDLKLNCTECSYTSVSTHHMKRHQNTHKKNATIRQCSRCEFKSTLKAVQSHEATCNNRPDSRFQYKCKLCSYSSQYKSRFDVHQRSHERNLPLISANREEPKKIRAAKCSKCSFSAESDTILKEHLKSHSTEKKPNISPTGKVDLMLNCTKCSYTSVSTHHMKRHQNIHKKNATIRQCSMCEFKSTLKAVQIHEATCNNRPDSRFQYKCKLCSFSSQYKSRFDVHQRSHERNLPLISANRGEPKKIKAVKCSKCSFSADSDITLKEHLKSHCIKRKPGISSNRENDLELNCTQCSYTAMSTYKLKMHQIIHEKNPTIRQCSMCAFKSTIKAVQNHESTCNNRPIDSRFQYKCKLCSYSSQYRSRFDAHQRSHEKNVPILPCQNNCGYKSTPRALRVHVTQRCKQKTSSLKTTTNVMVRDRPIDSGFQYKCKLCSYSSHFRSRFDAHQRSHEKNVPILPCQNNCGYKSTPRALRVHVTQRCKQKTSSLKTTTNVMVRKSESKTFKCSKCSFSTNLRIKLRFHIKKWHAKVSKTSGHKSEHSDNLDSALRHGLDGISGDKNNLKSSEINESKKKHHTPLKSGGLEFRCSHCSFSSNLRIKLKIHMKIHSGNGSKSFKCKRCSFVTAFLAPYNQHVRSHERHATRICACGFKSTPTAFITHRYKCNKDEIKTKNIKIKARNKIASIKSYVAEAPPLHSKKGEIKTKNIKIKAINKIVSIKSSVAEAPLLHCSKCKFSTDMLSELEVHMKKPHVNLFHCKLCSVVATSRSNFERHMGSHEHNPPIRKCPHCSFKSVQRCLYKHIAKEHKATIPIKCMAKSKSTKYMLSDEHTKKSGNVFHCNLCSVIANSWYNFQSHRRSHKDNLPVIQCPYCSFKSVKRCLHIHMMKEHEAKKAVKCIAKPKSTKTIQNVRTSQKSIKCKICSFATTKESSFNLHTFSHKQQQSFKKYPHSTFKSTVRHVSVHGNQEVKRRQTKKSDPPEIEGTFTNERGTNIEHHINQTSKERATRPQVVNKSKEKQFKCKLCSADGLRLRSFNRHMITHFKGQPIKQCNICEFKSTATFLQAHIRKSGHYRYRKLNIVAKPAKPNNSEIKPEQLGSDIANKKIRNQEGHSVSFGINKIRGNGGNSMQRASSMDFHCPLCEFSTNLRIKLNVHKMKRHSTSNKTKLSRNSKGQFESVNFKSSGSAAPDPKIDKKKKMIGSEKRAEKRLYSCRICSYKSSLKLDWMQHVNEHKTSSQSISKCRSCGFKGTLKILKLHSRICSTRK